MEGYGDMDQTLVLLTAHTHASCSPWRSICKQGVVSSHHRRVFTRVASWDGHMPKEALSVVMAM